MYHDSLYRECMFNYKKKIHSRITESPAYENYLFPGAKAKIAYKLRRANCSFFAETMFFARKTVTDSEDLLGS